MKELETLKLYRGATSVIELDFTGFNFESNSSCQFTIQKKYNEDIIFQHDFNKSIKYYVTFKDEFTAGLDDDKYKYDIMYMLNEERYPQCSISDVIVDEVVNDYVGEFDKNAVQVTEVLAEGVEITQSIKVTTSNVIIVSSNLQERIITPTKEEQVVLAEDGFDGMSKVVVEAIPSDYVIPTLQDKTIEVKPLENKNITADEGFNGLGVVNVIGTIDTETKEVTPTKETQTITRSDDKYIESVTVNAIPDNYIEPSGEMEITENGSYDVKDKASVKVETSGADLSEYFTETISSGSNSKGGWIPTFLKLPPLKNTGTSCAYMFKSCTAQEIDLSKFDTSNVTNMSNMFSSCAYLKSLDLSNFDTSKVTNMSSMFFGSDSIEKINVSNFDTSNVTDMNGMFRNLYTTTEIKGLNNFDTSKVTNMEYMFQNSSKLTSLDLSNFDTSNCSLFNYMFDCNYSFDTLNIGNFDFSKVQGGSYGKGMADIFRFFTGLVNLTFGVNFGKGFTGKSANNTYSKLDLSRNVNLSHDSLIDVINKLYDLNLTYDVANGGTLYTQQLVLGETNLAKLTEDEIAIATNKGWTVS